MVEKEGLMVIKRAGITFTTDIATYMYRFNSAAFSPAASNGPLPFSPASIYSSNFNSVVSKQIKLLK